MKVFNKTEKDFPTLLEYNNYLEEVEDLVRASVLDSFVRLHAVCLTLGPPVSDRSLPLSMKSHKLKNSRQRSRSMKVRTRLRLSFVSRSEQTKNEVFRIELLLSSARRNVRNESFKRKKRRLR